MSTLIINIEKLLQVRDIPLLLHGTDLSSIPEISNAYLRIEGNKIHSFGHMKDLSPKDEEEIIDAKRGYVMPAFVDCHTHLVFAASREKEFVQKIQGVTYAQIANSGGGILNSAAHLREMDEEELLEISLKRAMSIMRSGTGTVEIKSGYGLSTEAELKMLRVAKKIGELTPLKVKTTFLGAHAIPKDQKREEYISLLMEEMIPLVAEEKLADFIDVFCEEGFFSEKETIKILERGKEYGMVPKIHANQLNLSGGVQAGVRTSAISVDHLEIVSQTELDLLQDSGVIPTLLPGAAFFLRSSYPPARKMIEMGLPLAVASDFNPGSCPSGNMQLIWSLACIGMKMTPAEAFNAMTINSAFAIQMQDHSGIISEGRSADILITKPVSSFEYIPYSFGEDCLEMVILEGQRIT